MCPQIKDVTQVSRPRPGVSGGGKLGKKTPPDVQSPNRAKWSRRWVASRTDSRACVRTLQYGVICISVPGYCHVSVAGFLDPMTSSGTPL